jgi:hypothetical protein
VRRLESGRYVGKIPYNDLDARGRRYPQRLPTLQPLHSCYETLRRGLNPALGGDEPFVALSAALHERGMGLVLDMVPNHRVERRIENRRRHLQSLRWQIEPLRLGRLRLRQLRRDLVNEWVRELTELPCRDDPDHTLDAYSIRNGYSCATLLIALNTIGATSNC